MKILFLSAWFPFPPTNGSELRINALLRGLAAEHDVTLISLQRRQVSERAMADAQAVCREVRLVPWREFDPSSGRAVAGFLSPKPRSVVDTYSPEMAETIRQCVRSGNHELILASQLISATYAKEFGALPALLEEVELGVFAELAERNGPFAQRARNNLMWTKKRAYVRKLLPRFAACTVVSETERELLREVAPDYDAVEVVPNCINYVDYVNVSARRQPNVLIFAGAFTYSVNYEAMVWFVGDVYPLIQAQVPDVRLVITGDHAGLSLPPAENVTMAGFVDDIRTAVAEATISLAPILQGGGTRLKILEAMALGTPVVSTSKGAEGLHVTDREHLLIADSPEKFAHAVVSLMRDAHLRDRLATNARDLVAREYDWQRVLPRFLKLVERVANPVATMA